MLDQLCVNCHVYHFPPPFSRLDKSLQEVFLHHLLNVLSSSTPEHFLALQLVALFLATERGRGGVSGIVAEGGTWAATDFAVENMAEQVKERQQLLHAADDVQGQH